MKLIPGMLLVIGIALLSGCQAKKKAVTPPIPAPRQVELKPVPFVVPADSAVSSEQIKSWLTCNRSLDSLSVAYADSFKTDDAALRLRYQRSFTAAQAAICLRCGLKSAYEEYRWITTALAYPRNRPLAAQFNIAVH